MLQILNQIFSEITVPRATVMLTQHMTGLSIVVSAVTFQSNHEASSKNVSIGRLCYAVMSIWGRISISSRSISQVKCVTIRTRLITA